MNKLSPTHFAASVVLALIGTSAGAATSVVSTPSTTTGSNAAGGTATATPSVFANGHARGVIIIDNGTAGVVEGVDANGERVGGQVIAEGLSGLSPNASASGLSPNAMAESSDLIVTRSGSSVIAPELSALERKELRKRQNVGKNQQLLNTIAPRTSVDRTRQMPDDPLTPALTSSR